VPIDLGARQASAFRLGKYSADAVGVLSAVRVASAVAQRDGFTPPPRGGPCQSLEATLGFALTCPAPVPIHVPCTQMART
jgi:hypothetical protein